jgi:uncharacterized protein YcbX
VQVATVRSVTRYPVKSMAGEELAQVQLDARGVLGDRVLAVRTADGRLGSGKTSRRFRRVEGLREIVARRLDGGRVHLLLPDGTSLHSDDPDVDARLSSWLGQPVTLVAEGAVSHFDEDGLHLLTTAALVAVHKRSGVLLDPRRARANLLFDAPVAGFVEDGWLGADLRVGGAVIRVSVPMPRCDMVNQAALDLPCMHGALRALGEQHDAELGVVASVRIPGVVAVGDAVERID